MSIFFRAPAAAEQRAVTSIAGWGRGDDVTSSTSMESSLSVVPVFAACRLISDNIATLPLQAYRDTNDGTVRRELPEVFARHGRIAWVQQALMSLLLRGNAYGYVTDWTPNLFPRRVVWLNPERVSVDTVKGAPVYRYEGTEIPRMSMKHIRAYALPGQVTGVSPIGACSSLGSVGADVQAMMRDWFKGRALPGSTFKNSQMTFDAESAEDLSDRLAARIRVGKPLVYGSDWEFQPITLSADDAAFIASSKLTATQVASIYGVPPEKIGGEASSSLTYSTVELNNIDFAQSSLRPWTEKLEEEFSSWLPQPQYVKFNLDAGIRVATKDRYDVHRIAREIGLNNIDELRALEDLPPLPGDQGTDYTPLGKSQPTPSKETR